MATDVFDAHLTPDKTSYVTGERITLTLTGVDHFTSDPATEVDTISGTLTASNGAAFNIPPQNINISRPGATTDLPLTLVSVTGTSGRIYTVSGNVATATA